MKIILPSYYESFRCIAGKCPDSCCQEWDVLIDPDTANRYRAVSGQLGVRLRQVMSEDEDGNTVMTITDGRCPMWRKDGLCRIQAELGEDFLCQVCRDYPRLKHDYGDFIEMGLELSCPEAARLILNAPWEAPIVNEIPGGEEPEYDREDMKLLLETRKEALSILNDPSFTQEEALAILLIYGYHAQDELDTGSLSPFHREDALDEARNFAKDADIDILLQFFSKLQILTDRWQARLHSPALPCQSPPLRALARCGIERYWLQAVSDYDLVSRVKMVIASCILVKALGGDPVATAQLYSKEIDNSCENVDAVLDAAYSHPAFTDEKLLNWLLNGVGQK